MLKVEHITSVEELSSLPAPPPVTRADVLELSRTWKVAEAQARVTQDRERDACRGGTEIVVGPGIDGRRHVYCAPQRVEEVLGIVLEGYESWVETAAGNRVRVLRDYVEVLRPFPADR